MPTMGRFLLASFALLGSVQAFATTGEPAVDPNAPAGFSDDAIQFMSSWMGSTTGGKRRELQEPEATQTLNCVEDCVGGCPFLNPCYLCTAVVSKYLNPNANFWVLPFPPNDNVITKKELAKTLDEFVCTVQKSTCPEADSNAAAESAVKAPLFAPLAAANEQVAAANERDCKSINWGSAGATDRCVNMACDDPPSQMGALLCGLESIVDEMYGWFTSPDNKWKDASFYGVNTVPPLNGIAVPNDPDTNAQPEGIYTDGIVQTCVDQNWILKAVTAEIAKG